MKKLVLLHCPENCKLKGLCRTVPVDKSQCYQPDDDIRYFCILCDADLTGAGIPELISHYLIGHIDSLITTDQPNKKRPTI